MADAAGDPMSLPPPSPTVEAPLDEPTTPTPVIKKKPARRTLARDLADLRFDIERITDRQKSMQIRSPGPSNILPNVSSQQKASLPKSTPAKRKRVTATDAVTPPKKKQAKTEPTKSLAASPSPSTSPSPKRIAKRKRSFTNTATPKKLNLDATRDEENETVDIVGLSPNAPPAPLDVENHLDSPAPETSPEKTERPIETPKKKIRSLKKEAEALKEEIHKWDRRKEDENRRKGSILHLFPKDDDKEGAKTPRTRKPKPAGPTTKDKPQGKKRGRPPKRKPQPEEALEAENDEKEEESPLEESELEKEDEADNEATEDKEEEKGQEEEESQGDEEEGSAKEEEEKGGSKKRRRTRSEAELAYLNTDKERLERRARVRNEKEREETKSTPKKAISTSSTPVRVAKRRRSRLPAETLAKEEVEEEEAEREEEITTTPTKTTPRKKSRGRSEVERLKLENERELSRADSRKLRAFGTPQANRVSESARIIDKARTERVRREKDKMQRKQEEKKEQEKKANKKAMEEARRKKEEAEEEKEEVPKEEETEEEEEEAAAPTLTLEKMQEVFHQTRSLLQLVGDSRLHQKVVAREKEKKEIKTFWEEHVLYQAGGCLYISGSPGTGKTATITEVIAEMKTWEKKLSWNCDEVEIRPSFVIELNGMDANCAELHNEIIKRLQGRTSTMSSNISEVSLRQLLSNGFNGAMTVIIIDELDQLTLNPRVRAELANLFQISATPKSSLILIGLANTLTIENLLPSLEVAAYDDKLKQMQFSAYTHEELIKIAEYRVSFTKEFWPTPLFDAHAIPLTAHNVAKGYGDARRMLELLGEGVKIAAAAAVAQWELKPLTSIPPVTALHVGQAMSKLLSVTDRKTDAIEALPTAQKILLAVAIAKTKGGNILDPLELRKEFRRIYEKHIGPVVHMGTSFEKLMEQLACSAVIEEKGSKLKRTVHALISEADFLYALRDSRSLLNIWQELTN